MTDIETYPVMCSIYGIQQRSRLDSLKYFHVVDRLPPDIAHEIFAGIAIDITFNIITQLPKYLQSDWL